MKTVLTLVIAIFLTAANYAQQGLSVEVLAQPGMTMGGIYQIPAGLNSYNPWVIVGREFTFGENTGADIGYNFDNKKGINFGLFYSQEGQDYNYNYLTGGNLTRTVNLNYLNVPVQFCFVNDYEKTVTFTFSAGLYFGYLLNYKESYIGQNSDYTAEGKSIKVPYFPYTYTFITEPYKPFDFGGVLSIGVQFKLSENIYVPLMLNYQIGLRDIKNENSQYYQANSGTCQFWGDYNNGPATDPNTTLTYRNSSLGLKTGLKIIL